MDFRTEAPLHDAGRGADLRLAKEEGAFEAWLTASYCARIICKGNLPGAACQAMHLTHCLTYIICSLFACEFAHVVVHTIPNSSAACLLAPPERSPLATMSPGTGTTGTVGSAARSLRCETLDQSLVLCRGCLHGVDLVSSWAYLALWRG